MMQGKAAAAFCMHLQVVTTALQTYESFSIKVEGSCVHRDGLIGT